MVEVRSHFGSSPYPRLEPMAQPLLFKPGGQQPLLTRLDSYIIIEIAKPLRPHERSVDVLERAQNTFANCEHVTCSAGKAFGEARRREGVRVGLAKP
eukprot:4502172-Amphidinium_carterae.1